MRYFLQRRWHQFYLYIRLLWNRSRANKIVRIWPSELLYLRWLKRNCFFIYLFTFCLVVLYQTSVKLRTIHPLYVLIHHHLLGVGQIKRRRCTAIFKHDCSTIKSLVHLGVLLSRVKRLLLLAWIHKIIWSVVS